MTDKVFQILALRLTSDSRVATIGSILMYIGSIAFCVLACREMVGLSLTGSQITTRLLLIICATMLMIVGGLLLSVLGRLSDSHKV